MKIRDGVDDFRGLEALWSAPIMMNALIIQHNFIGSHTRIDEVPCNRARQELDSRVNKWLDLIRLSHV